MPGVDVTVPDYGVEALKSSGAEMLDFYIESDEIGAYTCKVLAKNDQNEKVDTDVTFTVYISCTDADFGTNCKLYSVNGGEIQKEHIRTYNKDRGLIFFKINLNLDYLLDVRYDLSVDKSIADGSLEIAESARPGETVTVEIKEEIPVGQVAVIYYTVGTGPKVYVEDNSFVMPYGNVVIGYTIEDVIYTVEFISDGEVILSKTYTYGAVIEIPENPVKDPDGINTYTFVGWTPEISDVVSADATYVAVFEAAPIPKDTTTDEKDEVEHDEEPDDSNVGIIIAIVGVVLIGGGVGAYFALRKKEFFIRFMETKVLPLFVKKDMALSDDEISADTETLEQGDESVSESTSEDESK
jgi:hypothetical protein